MKSIRPHIQYAINAAIEAQENLIRVKMPTSPAGPKEVDKAVELVMQVRNKLHKAIELEAEINISDQLKD